MTTLPTLPTLPTVHNGYAVAATQARWEALLPLFAAARQGLPVDRRKIVFGSTDLLSAVRDRWARLYIIALPIHFYSTCRLIEQVGQEDPAALIAAIAATDDRALPIKACTDAGAHWALYPDQVTPAQVRELLEAACGL